MDEAISRRADELIGQYYLGYNLEIPDALIAATVIEYNLPLLTKNQRDFRFVPEIVLFPYPTA